MSSQLNDLVADLLDWSQQWIAGPIAALEQRLSPLAVLASPYWNDPLWRALILIVGLVLAVLAVLWLARAGWSGIVGLLKFIVDFSKRLLILLFAPLKRLGSWLSERFAVHKRYARQRLMLRRRMRRITGVLKYLSTSREWRYSTPWYLLLGEEGAEPESLLAGIRLGKRAALLHKEKALKAAGSKWHFFDNGVVIRCNNAVLQEGAQGTCAMPKLSRLLELIHRYRPERPLDGLVVALSAQSLLEAKDIYARQALSERLFKQLWLVQKKSNFVLPVYLVVTRCEAVPGFEAYWQAQGEQHLREMIGWSNPLQLESAFDADWVDQAFEQVVEGLQQAQLDVAASNREIADIDSFMLFHRYFQSLRSPLKEVVDGAFSRSRFQAPLPLRGIYFCGGLEQRVAFCDQLFNKKIFAEVNLATPLERRLLSSEKVLQRFQLSTIGLGALLVVWLGIDSMRMVSYNQDFERVVGQVLSEPSDDLDDCQPLGQNSYRLLAHLGEIGRNSDYWSMPAAWFDTQMYRNQEFVGNELISKRLFTSLECRINIKAAELNKVLHHQFTDDLDTHTLREQLFSFSSMLANFHTGVDEFTYLAGPLGNDLQVESKLSSLLDFVYQVPVPDASRPSSPLVTGGVQVMKYDVHWQGSKHHLTDESGDLQHLSKHAEMLRDAFIRDVSPDIVNGLSKAGDSTSQTLLAKLDQLGDWLTATNLQWTVPYSASPCGKASKRLDRDINALRRSGDHSSEALDHVANLFSEAQCYNEVQDQLLKFSLPKYGPAYVRESQLLVLNEDLVPLLLQIEALEQLAFAQQRVDAMSALPNSEVYNWRFGNLAEAIHAIREYQQFTASYWKDGSPFYEQALKQQLSNVVSAELNKAMSRYPAKVAAGTAVDVEAQLAASVDNFVNVQQALFTLDQLLAQLGDSRNRIWLKQSARNFARNLLEQTDALVKADKLYVPQKNPDWQQLNFAQALFGRQTDRQLDQYAIAQRQRLSFLAQAYAQPLVDYLLNSGGVEQLGGSSQRWLATLNVLSAYQRKETDNDLSLLESLITAELPQMSMIQCEGLDKRSVGGSWFGEKMQRIDLQVWAHCKKSTQARAIDSYLAMARRFDSELAGLYPFSDISQAGKNDLPLNRAIRFFEDPANDPKLLTAQLDAMAKAYPAKIPGGWKNFLNQLDLFKQWLDSGMNKQHSAWAGELLVEFNSQVGGAKGSDQIVRWELTSNQQLIGSPNNGEQLQWQVGDPLALQLTWAESSAYQPYTQAPVPYAVFVPNQPSVRFEAAGAWGVFEWLSRYGSGRIAGQSSTGDSQNLVFHVPVSFKSEQPQAQKIAYVSQPGVALSGQVVDGSGARQAISWPINLPTQAPGFSDD